MEPGRQKNVWAASFEALRFRIIITAAMRLINLNDSIATRVSDVRPTANVVSPPRPIVIPSDNRPLEACLVTPPEAPVAAVLILHGIGERLAYWHDAQQLLAANRIASLVFHYSGYGKSSGSITPANLRQDTSAAFTALQQLVPLEAPPFVLGLSMGTGVIVDAAPALYPQPPGIILCQPFSSLRAGAGAVCDAISALGGAFRLVGFVLRPLVHFVPDIYRTAATLRAAASTPTARSPLLIVHADADELFPVSMAKEIIAAAITDSARSVELVVPRGFTHNDAYLRPSQAYWQPIVDFIDRNTPHP